MCGPSDTTAGIDGPGRIAPGQRVAAARSPNSPDRRNGATRCAESGPLCPMRHGTATIHARVAGMPAWLDDDPRPLDWNGPVDRLFSRFPDSALDRPIIDHFERAARLHRERIAIRDAKTALRFGELWDGLSGLAEILAAESEAGDLIGILLPAGPMFALAMFACLAAGRPFVALDTGHP